MRNLDATMDRRTLLLGALGAAAAPAFAKEPPFALAKARRILFLGDSITAAGMYVQYFEGYLLTRFPQKRYEVFSLGLPSETCTGLSEPDHPWPRPNVHERLERALERLKPDTVVACYGMNDGIYYPFSPKRFEQYQSGIRSLIQKCEAAGAKVIHLTPSAFDPVPVRPQTQPLGAEKYSWVRPYDGYDEVLTRYAEWLLTLRSEGRTVADAHAATAAYLGNARKTKPSFRFAGDGVHMDATGEWLMADALLTALHAPAAVAEAILDVHGRIRRGNVKRIQADDAGLRFTWTSRIPMPYDPAWDASLLANQHIADRLNRHRLTVTGLGPGAWEFWEGDRRIGQAMAAEWAAGVDLLRFRDLTTNRHARALFPLIRDRERLLSGAWLTAVGHKRPDTPAGKPLSEALPQAEALEKRMRELASPVSLELTIRR